MRQGEVYDSARLRTPILEELVQLAKYRELVVLFISRNIKTRYKRSFLGVIWTLLQPLLMMTVMTLVFSQLFTASRGQYAVFILAGLLVWNVLAESTSDAMLSLTRGGNLLTRIYVPKAVYAVSALGSSLLNLGLSLGPLFLIMLALGEQIRLTVLFLPISVLFLAMFALGLGLGLSALAVYFADLVPLYTVILRAWFYLTPIIYPAEFIPESVRWILKLNPMFYMVEIFRQPIVGGAIPDAQIVGAAAIWATGSLLIGWLVFALKADDYTYRV